ncbi:MULTISPECIES: efflux RND transporter permease subunit [unclassified Ectothiorhodospira]|uniref:efflux RND transporter permease subunit n=1 Tax=unclassified Ectothiorhodospira TaxID=2684909 RepID=UPI001EE7A584|nr:MULTISPECIES: efflux RND transporter permease subunit [unclassified Ectothiorhodospira]MCG5517214.1 efflux RND transporter permease subunit [Ectothiorhodospira sp. 9100]MCG5520130.1 efflux RND transporter permease subunit [Ectothiorhodospira sp. 9905]
MFRRFLENHFLANAVFLAILIVGVVAYFQLPRQQDPTVNLNWVVVQTFMPGASAIDVERQVTDVLEEAAELVSDIRFISSTSQRDVSLIMIRLEEMSQREVNERINDLHREIQNVEGDLPAEARRPTITTISSANAYPTTMVAVVGLDDDENLRFQAQRIEQDLERLSGTDRVEPVGLRDPELQVLFDPDDLVGLGLTPSILAQTVSTYFRDLAAGTVGLGDQEWLVRLQGTENDPEYLADIPLLSAHGEIPLRSVADVVRGREDADDLARYLGGPAVLLPVFKKDGANEVDFLNEIRDYLADYNERASPVTGVQMVLLDDQTLVTRQAIGTMQRNAAVGLLLVLITTWLLLGSRIAFATCFSLVFVIAGTFLFLGLIGQTLNVIVLLGLMIVLGMLVDDTVMVAEAIHRRLQQGMSAMDASIDALREVAAPVTAAVLTTIAAFLPLMLVPGVLGEFMKVAPIVVTVALLLSLVEAFWILPSHIAASRPQSDHLSRSGQLRSAVVRRARLRYGLILTQALRRPKITLTLFTALLVLALAFVATGLIRTEFFATDSARLFFVNVEMPAGTPLEKTLATTLKVESAIAEEFRDGELRSKAGYAGLQFTNAESLFGSAKGQIQVSLHPQTRTGRDVDTIIEAVRRAAANVPGPNSVWMERRISGAPPMGRPVSVKVRGNDLDEIRVAADRVMSILEGIPAAYDVVDDADAGGMELSVRLDPDAIMRAGLDPGHVIRDLRLLTDGEVVAAMRDRGERIGVRVRARVEALEDIDRFLDTPISVPDGRPILLGQLVHHEIVRAEGNIRHFNLRRAITVESEVDEAVMDAASVHRLVQREWDSRYASLHPNIDLDFTGDFDDILESIEALLWLFLLGLMLVYLILGTQFRSYTQPLIVLTVVPMALTGVLIGLLISQQPLSVYTLYGVVALAGIAVNDAIVLISAANDRLRQGMPLMHAVLHATRRRFIPIIITSVTTIAGLFSLAVGLGGKSLMWGPLAGAIVWGLLVSTILTLFVIPIMYSLIVRPSAREEVTALPLPRALDDESPSLLKGFLRLITQGALSGRALEAKDAPLGTFADSPALRKLYNEGQRALADEQYEAAIRLFEAGAREAPQSPLFHLCSAQALALFMQRSYGADLGYLARMRRYLNTARRLAPGDARLPVLEQMASELEAVAEDPTAPT